jgi:hypothetical protein
MSSAETTPKSINFNNFTIRTNGDDTHHFGSAEFSLNPENVREDDNQVFGPNSTPTGYRPTLSLEYNGQQTSDYREEFYLPNSFIPKPKGEVEVILVSPVRNISCQWLVVESDTFGGAEGETAKNSIELLTDRVRRLPGTGSLSGPTTVGGSG